MAKQQIKNIKDQINKTRGGSEKAVTLAGMKQGDVIDLLGKYESRINAALPSHLSAGRLIQVAATLIAKNPAIAECTASSIIGAVMQASILGFPPVEALGYCYFVPYGRNIAPKGAPKKYIKEVQFQIGYKGYNQLARQSGQITDLYGYAVHEGDFFEYQYGTNRYIKHKSGEKFGKVTHAYAVAEFLNGGMAMIVLPKIEIERLRLRNPSQSNTTLSGPWRTDYGAMAVAKACKQLSKFLPLSIDAQQAIATDEAVLDEKTFSRDGSGIDVQAVDISHEEVDVNDPENYPDGFDAHVPPEKIDKKSQEEE